jgi:hypothetical protein
LAACRRPTCQLYTELLDLLFLQTFSTTHLCMVNVRCLLSLCYPSPSFVFLSVSIPSPTKTKHFPLPLSPSPLASYFSLFHPSLHCFTLHHRIFSLYTLLSPLYVHFRLVPANPPIVSFFFFTSTEATHHAGPSIARIVLQIYRGTATLYSFGFLGAVLVLFGTPTDRLRGITGLITSFLVTWCVGFSSCSLFLPFPYELHLHPSDASVEIRIWRMGRPGLEPGVP